MSLSTVPQPSKPSAPKHLRHAPSVDFTSETPNTDKSHSFHCTPDIDVRLTPYPHNNAIYTLDFTDPKGHRLEKAPFHVFDTGLEPGTNEFRVFPINSSGDDDEKSGSLDVYLVNPHHAVEVREPDGKEVKKLSFSAAQGKVGFAPREV